MAPRQASVLSLQFHRHFQADQYRFSRRHLPQLQPQQISSGFLQEGGGLGYLGWGNFGNPEAQGKSEGIMGKAWQIMGKPWQIMGKAWKIMGNS